MSSFDTYSSANHLYPRCPDANVGAIWCALEGDEFTLFGDRRLAEEAVAALRDLEDDAVSVTLFYLAVGFMLPHGACGISMTAVRPGCSPPTLIGASRGPQSQLGPEEPAAITSRLR